MKKILIFIAVVYSIFVMNPVIASNLFVSQADVFVAKMQKTDVLYMSFEYNKRIVIEDLALFNSKYQN